MKMRRTATSPGNRVAELSETASERLERFVSLQRRAQQLLTASPAGFRRYWERNLRKRSCDARF